MDESFVKMNLEDLSDQHGMETTEADKDEFTTARNTEDNASGQGREKNWIFIPFWKKRHLVFTSSTN